jgi:hypothetical protein
MGGKKGATPVVSGLPVYPNGYDFWGFSNKEKDGEFRHYIYDVPRVTSDDLAHIIAVFYINRLLREGWVLRKDRARRVENQPNPGLWIRARSMAFSRETSKGTDFLSIYLLESKQKKLVHLEIGYRPNRKLIL